MGAGTLTSDKRTIQRVRVRYENGRMVLRFFDKSRLRSHVFAGREVQNFALAIDRAIASPGKEIDVPWDNVVRNAPKPEKAKSGPPCKTCPACAAINYTGARRCSECNELFTIPKQEG
jgi:hypothetical protein